MTHQPALTNDEPAVQSLVGDQVTSDISRLLAWFDGHQQIAVAYSGGVDSSVVLAAALRSTAERVVAVTARSPSVASWQLQVARQVASELHAQHVLIDTDEVELDEYRVNDSQRCFHCKSTLYRHLDAVCRSSERGAVGIDNPTIVSGTNADDLGDFRPGIAAGDQAQVRKPLAELGLNKSDVRRIARGFRLSNADLPASPCLASRIAYGVEVTPERLRRVELGEQYLRDHDFSGVRVRYHQDDLARIEVLPAQIHRLNDPTQRRMLCDHFRQLGFKYITIDLQGFSSGSLNRPLVQLDTSNRLPTQDQRET